MPKYDNKVCISIQQYLSVKFVFMCIDANTPGNFFMKILNGCTPAVENHHHQACILWNCIIKFTIE